MFAAPFITKEAKTTRTFNNVKSKQKKQQYIISKTASSKRCLIKGNKILKHIQSHLKRESYMHSKEDRLFMIPGLKMF